LPRLILLLAVGIVIYLLVRRAQMAPPHKRRSEYIKLGLGIAVVMVVGLTLTGKMHWIGAALTGLLVAARQLAPVLIRLFPMLSSLKAGAATPGGGQTSTVETAILRMQLDHDSGELQGEVLQGPYREWRLSEMDREQLRDLYRYCQAEDQDSLQLLQSYLQQRFPGQEQFDNEPPPAGSGSGGMSRSEALAVLGLGEDADREAIVNAHRKLMQKLHPDRGGNDYLAAKINQAKDLLLG
jgi:hypothetical protein